MRASKLTKEQKREYRKIFQEDGRRKVLIATVQHDDRCGNGHNTFSITGEVWRANKAGEPIGNDCEMCGCIHDVISEHIPELRKYIKWHLVSTDGPLHYLANAEYWAGGYPQWCDGKPNSPPNVAHLKSTIVWGGAPGYDTSEDKIITNWADLEIFLINRLPELMKNFQTAVEELGLTY